MDVSRWVEHGARWSPERTALRFEGSELSYADFGDRVARLTGGLLDDLGTEPGDRVAYLGPNRPELLTVFFAAARAGATFVPLDPDWPADTLRPLVDASEPRLLVADAACVDLAKQLEGPDLVAVADLPLGRAVATGPAHDPATPVLLAYPAGEPPRGVLLTHRAVAATALGASTALRLTAADHVLAALPLYEVGGLVVQAAAALSVGATVTVHRAAEPGAVLADVERVTTLLTDAALTRELVAHHRWDGSDLSALRLVATTSAAGDVTGPWCARGVPVVAVYGRAECCGLATVTPLGEPPVAGRAVLTCDVRVVDAAGDDAAPGEPGEVLVRGPHVMREYWRDAVATSGAVVDGWLRTGDTGHLDETGYLHVTSSR